MERKFRILSVKKANQKSFHLQLQGDFDGTSAYELADALLKCSAHVSDVAVNTDGLRNINAFGLDVFSIQLKKLRKTATRIDFTGRYKTMFAQE
ncbi:MAG: hypothetical protein VR64_17675 [Desulfatitalea sp. BRH_c12]|nr:MAG: hypothetical protein VR64_17675 [Desulfatitalea sp. BRH_c12]